MTAARRKDLDLVEVNPAANPPVCKIVNYGKYVYDLNKREKDTKKARLHLEAQGTHVPHEHRDS